MPPVATFLTTWGLDVVGVIFVVVTGGLYAVGIIVSRRIGHRWPVLNTLAFYLLGLGGYAWVSFGFLGFYSIELRWAFTTRIALLLFAVPVLMSFGKPVALARQALHGRPLRLLDRFLGSRFMRLLGNAVFEPVFTLVLFLVFLTPLAGTLRLSPGVEGAISVVIPVIGLLMVIPIMENLGEYSGFFITVEFMLSFAALVFDAIPGILLRLNGSVLDRVAPVVGNLPAWWPNTLHDQHLSGDFLWFLAEITDIPVLVVLFMRWSRIDRRDAKSVDDLSDEDLEALTQAHLRGDHR
ncbi:MAG: putative rane protein [Actinomycetota bacterium]|nr:putative rane protein [Actinomycetota bacterium]